MAPRVLNVPAHVVQVVYAEHAVHLLLHLEHAAEPPPGS